MNVPRPLLLPVLALAILAAGCGSKPSSYYMLREDTQPLRVESLPTTTLAVSAVNIPEYLNRRGVVIRSHEGSILTVPMFNVWAESLDTAVQRVVASRLAAPLLEQGISVIPTQDAHSTPAYAVVIDLIRLDASDDGTICLEARWGVVDASTRSAVASGSFARSTRIDLPEFGSTEMFDTVVTEQGRLVQQFGDDLAGHLAGIVRPKAR